MVPKALIKSFHTEFKHLALTIGMWEELI